MTARFWVTAALAAITVAAILFLRARELRYSSRSRSLENAVRQRTEELERERFREKSRNRILEMLVTNQPLGAVLDGIAELVLAEAVSGQESAVICAILLRQSDRPCVGAAPGAPNELVAALQTPHAVPFEVWKGTTEFRHPALDPAWKIFMRQLQDQAGGESLPTVIRSKSIGRPDRSLGSCLVFDRSDPPSEFGHEILDVAARLAQLAIEHSRLYDDLNFQAHHDSLTGLPNRVLFEYRLAQALIEARSRKGKVAVLYIDLDRFKQINDTMSHRVGDLFLVEVAGRLRSELRPGDMVARIGGDEFNVLLTPVEGAVEAEAVGDRLRNALRQPAMVEGRSLIASASIGIALFPDDGSEAEDLRREADAAMYCAKRLGRDRVQAHTTRNSTFDPVRMDHELKNALRERRFSVHYQPKVDAAGGFVGMEALLRLNHAADAFGEGRTGTILPDEFIPMAEESGLIVPLGAWVLDEVCHQINAWREMKLGLVPVAVNVSPVQLCRPDFAHEVEECLRRQRIPPACEASESAFR